MSDRAVRRGRQFQKLEGRLRRAKRRLRDAGVGQLLPPRVSVILPFYNVEKYIAECLDSILDQDFRAFEVIAVDDGSPDGTRAIVEEYAARDPRLRIVTRANGGLGAARNTGVQHARGRYLTFVDSDDRLPPGALRALVTSAEETGSDIVVGSVRRFDSNKTWRAHWVERVQMVERKAITVPDFLPLLRNLYTWDKLFRKDFYDAQGLQFREGVSYEDQPIVTQLLARAKSIDVITDVVYEYRAREDRSSISQQTATLRDLRFRIDAWDISREVLQKETSQEIYDGWLQTLFDSHFHWYLTSAGTVDDEYWKLLRSAVCDLMEGAPQELWDRTPPARRVLLELTRLDRRADAQEFVRQGVERPERWPATPRPDGLLMQLPFLGDPVLDESLFLLRPDQMEVEHWIENLHWDYDDGRLSCLISGWAYISKLDLTNVESKVSVVLRDPVDHSEHVFASLESPKPAYFPPMEDPFCDYSPGTFLTRIPLDEIDAFVGSENAHWQVLLRVEAAGFTVTSPVSRLARSGSAGAVSAASLSTGDRVVTEWRFQEPLWLRVLPRSVEAEDLSLDGRVLTGRLAGPRADDVKTIEVRVAGAVGNAKVRNGQFSLTVPPAASLVPGRPVSWHVLGRFIDDLPVGLGLRGQPDVSSSDSTGGLVVERSRAGQVALTEWVTGAVAESVEVSADGLLRVSGRLYGAPVETVALVAENKRGRVFGDEVAPKGDRFEAELKLERQVYRFGWWPLMYGEHDVTLRVRAAGSKEPIELATRLSADLNGTVPIRMRTDRLEGRVVRGPQGGVRVQVFRPLGDDRGEFNQARLRANPPSSSTLTRGVLMRSYFGESATDNGVSIQKELRRRGSDLPVYWAVHDYATVVPEGGIPVIVNSREWYRLLGTAQYYVDNMYQPEYHQKPAGQVIAQTFHGYPFKQMGHPHWRNLQFSQAKIAAYDARAAEWDYLVSPARYATPLLTRDFNYPGEVLEIGYPRNDVLQSAEADEIRLATRESLGIRPDQTAVLYAPTFRDYLAEDDMVADMADFFDFAGAMRALGDQFVILARGHAFNARGVKRVRVPGVVEVTDYPEVSDLYLAADAAIVDYSSLRFDFGVTGKPMIFHVPDLQRYKDTRGWLFDFETSAPGPLVDTTEDVVAQLLDLDGVRSRHQDQYDKFKADFLDLEDGRAGERFVDAVFVPRGDA